MQNDVFDDDDCVIDDQSNSGGESAQRHKIEALADIMQSDTRHGNGYWNHQAGHDRCTPIA